VIAFLLHDRDSSNAIVPLTLSRNAGEGTAFAPG